MSYKQTMQQVNTEKILTLIDIEYQSQGAYIKFSCPKCSQSASIKAYGDKKNLFYCPSCKHSGNVISLVELTKGTDEKETEALLHKAMEKPAEKITKPLTLLYELQHNGYLKDKGFDEKFCRDHELGVPKGKTMLAGCVAFAVKDEEGVKIAYFGIRMKDGKSVFHSSFNPELYLYKYETLTLDEPVYLVTDIFECISKIKEGQQCICNYGLPYLSQPQLELLKNVEHLILSIDETLRKSIALQLLENKNLIKFE